MSSPQSHIRVSARCSRSPPPTRATTAQPSTSHQRRTRRRRAVRAAGNAAVPRKSAFSRHRTQRAQQSPSADVAAPAASIPRHDRQAADAPAIQRRWRRRNALAGPMVAAVAAAAPPTPPTAPAAVSAAPRPPAAAIPPARDSIRRSTHVTEDLERAAPAAASRRAALSSVATTIAQHAARHAARVRMGVSRSKHAIESQTGDAAGGGASSIASGGLTVAGTQGAVGDVGREAFVSHPERGRARARTRPRIQERARAWVSPREPPAAGSAPQWQPRGGVSATASMAPREPPAAGSAPQWQPRGGVSATASMAPREPPAAGSAPQWQPRGGVSATASMPREPPAAGSAPQWQPRGGVSATALLARPTARSVSKAVQVQPRMVHRGSQTDRSPATHSAGLEAGRPECVVCLGRARDTVFAHGSTCHYACCAECADALLADGRSCPICRRPIDAVLRVFSA